MAKFLAWITMIALSGTLSTAIAGEPLTGEKLRMLVVGNTEQGQYRDKGKAYTYWAFYRKDGKIKGKDNSGKYSGKYEIKADGCLYADYDHGKEDDGCYYYEHVSGKTYGVEGPNDFASVVEIFEGRPPEISNEAVP